MRQTSNSAHCFIILATLVGLVFGVCCPRADASPYRQQSTDESGESIEAIQIQALDGTALDVAAVEDENTFTVLCFLGTECPLAKLYTGRLVQLSSEFKNVRFVGIFPNVQDSNQDIAKFTKSNNVEFEFAKDIDNEIADRLDVLRTPEVILLDASLQIRYRGRVDNQYSPGVSRNKATSHELRNAIEELVAGKPVSIVKTEPEGCLLGRVRKVVDSETTSDEVDSKVNVTFSKQISRVLQRNCVECHREGEIGPFTLTDYDETVGWADMILEVIDDGRMPPWHANESHPQFSNSRKMSSEDKQLLHAWVAQGAPLGDRKDLPAPYRGTTGWHLPKAPDKIIAMRDRPFTVPAEGTVDYQYFVVDPGFKEDRWVSAAEVMPSNRSVVHHSIVFVRPPDGVRMTGVGWLASYVPGQTLLASQKSQARLIPAGSKLVFQQHYTPNGTEQSDVTKVGLVFADEKDVEWELTTLISLDQTFEIKPEDPSHKVSAELPWLPKGGVLLSIAPHMHYRGKSFKGFVTDKKTGDKKTLLDVPSYDFNWQHRYELLNPIGLSEIGSLSMEVEFDNSKDNPFNPDPSQHVTWGDQTWEEMAVCFYDVTLPRSLDESEDEDSTEQANPFESNVTSKVADNKPVDSPEVLAEIDRIEKQYFDRFDKNKDGRVVMDELPLASRHWSFRRLDSNDDGKISRPEIRAQARSRVRRRKD